MLPEFIPSAVEESLAMTEKKTCKIPHFLLLLNYMRQAIFLWWLGIFFLALSGAEGLFASPVYAQLQPDEQVTQCYRGEGQCVPGTGNACSSEPADYIDANGVKRQEYRSDANFNYNASVRGAGCGEVKSSPIVLQETVTYPGPDKKDQQWSACTIRPSWGGEIQMNYDFFGKPGLNLYVPFAQQIADQWAGTMDTEHLTVSDYDKLVARTQQTTNIPDKIDALNELNQKNGVLRKLLTQDQQDVLKCGFANWVARRHNAKDSKGNNNAAPSMYLPLASGEEYYKPDDKVMLPLLGGTACRNVACPLTSSDSNYNRNTCLTNYDNGTTKFQDPYGNWYAPGPAWQKMAIFPNEKTLTKIDYYVCGFDTFPQYVAYPEVMRLGLAANELFKIFTDKSSQDKFYAQPNFALLKSDPLANLFPPGSKTDPTAPPTADSNNIMLGKDINNVPKQTITPKTIATQKLLTPQQKFVKNLTAFLNEYLPKVKTVLAKTAENITVNKSSAKLAINKPFDLQLKKIAAKLLAQNSLLAQDLNLSDTTPGACGGINPSFNPVINSLGQDKYQICWKIEGSNVSTSGPTGCDWGYKVTASGAGGTSASFSEPIFGGQNNCLGKPAGQAPVQITCNGNPTTGNGGTAQPLIVTSPGGAAGLSFNFEVTTVKTVGGADCRPAFSRNCQSDANGKTTCNVPSAIPSGTNLAGRCDPSNACCETAGCGPATCAPCQKTQVGPSKTSVWPQGYPASHQYLGDGDASTGEFKDPVIYSFRPTLANCTFTPDKDEFGQYSYCGEESSSCHNNKTGRWSCTREHDRVVNVYNTTPYLGSVWAQTADPIWGFESAIKPLGITGSGNIPNGYSGCTSDQNLIIDQFGNYVPQHATTPIDYGFGIKRLNSENADSITVSLKSGADGQINFYRLGGTCNANKWWTEKVLNPMLSSGLTTGLTGGTQQQNDLNKAIVTTCTQKNITIQVSKYYDSQCNQSDTPQTGYTQGATILQGTQQ